MSDYNKNMLNISIRKALQHLHLIAMNTTNTNLVGFRMDGGILLACWFSWVSWRASSSLSPIDFLLRHGRGRYSREYV